MNVDVKKIFDDALAVENGMAVTDRTENVLVALNDVTMQLFHYADQCGIKAESFDCGRKGAVFKYQHSGDNSVNFPRLIRVFFNAKASGMVEAAVNCFDMPDLKSAGSYDVSNDTMQGDLEAYVAGVSNALIKWRPE